MALVRILLPLCALTACSDQPRHKAWAIVVSIAAPANPKWDSDKLVVTARSQDGAMGQKFVPTARLNCRVGDTVHGSVKGIALTLDDHACEP
jgi:hypothetical protein